MELKYEEYKVKTLFVNMLLKRGKKTSSEKILQTVLINLKKITNQISRILFRPINRAEVIIKTASKKPK